jgi:hypothetical protein
LARRSWPSATHTRPSARSSRTTRVHRPRPRPAQTSPILLPHANRGPGPTGGGPWWVASCCGWRRRWSPS